MKFLNTLRVIRFGGIRLYVTNAIFKYLTGVNTHFNENIHFTSQMIGNNLTYYKDGFTLRSFKTSSNCYFQSLCGIQLGKNFLFASGLKLISANHAVSVNRKTICGKPIIIGDNCWFGANVTILPGVVIGNNCVVGAGSVVTKSFIEDNLIIAGNPARIIRSIE
ncbi:MAG: DapH/DapD/GlmU-related protein [Bacteroidetes bacterium]|nr:DapH/DapD/GlmU-related protein [Bacteroidota bacterium]MDA1126863.1 DapH/DapD/GlmU-related protein [Bacteroidota bacterium]